MAKTPKIGKNRNIPNGGNGRPKGAKNKTTALLKDAILKAAEQAGNTLEPKGGLVKYLQHQAVVNPGPFLSLIGKVLPLQVAGPDDGEGNPTSIKITIV